MEDLLNQGREQFPQYRWRGVKPEDAPRVHATYVACDEADGTDIAWTVDDLERIFEDSWMQDVKRDTLVASNAAGEVAGYGAILANPAPEKVHNALLFMAVHPEHRGLNGEGIGLEEFIICWFEKRGAEILAEIDPQRPGALHYTVDQLAVGRAGILKSRNFTPVRYFFRMQRELRDEVGAFPLPEGIRLVNYDSEYDRPALETFNESFADHWNHEPVTEEDWQRWFVGTVHFRPEMSYLALDGDQIAALILVAVDEQENLRKGTREGWINDLGTRPAWRRRGIASALLAASLRSLKEAGLDSALLGVDSANPTGALRVYERLGFQVIRRFIRYEK